MSSKMRAVGMSAILLAVVPFNANAAKVNMICENSRREYLLSYDEMTRTLYADTTLYRVLAVEKTASHFIIAGLTVNDGPTFRLHFQPYKKIEFFSDNQLIQTDGCKSVK